MRRVFSYRKALADHGVHAAIVAGAALAAYALDRSAETRRLRAVADGTRAKIEGELDEILSALRVSEADLKAAETTFATMVTATAFEDGVSKERGLALPRAVPASAAWHLLFATEAGPHFPAEWVTRLAQVHDARERYDVLLGKLHEEHHRFVSGLRLVEDPFQLRPEMRTIHGRLLALLDLQAPLQRELGAWLADERLRTKTTSASLGSEIHVDLGSSYFPRIGEKDGSRFRLARIGNGTYCFEASAASGSEWNPRLYLYAEGTGGTAFGRDDSAVVTLEGLGFDRAEAAGSGARVCAELRAGRP